MGKGQKNRIIRQNSRKIAMNHLQNSEVQKAMHREINAQLVKAHDRFIRDEESVILWTLHTVFGFGAKRLKAFYDQYDKEWEKLREHYEVSTDDMRFLTVEKLKQIGVDLEAWDNEAKNKAL